jgi:hypothetical protein
MNYKRASGIQEGCFAFIIAFSLWYKLVLDRKSRRISLVIQSIAAGVYGGVTPKVNYQPEPQATEILSYVIGSIDNSEQSDFSSFTL